MSVEAKVEVFGRELDLLIDETLSDEAAEKAFGRSARRIIEMQDDINDRAMKRDVRYRTVADGKPVALVERARRHVSAEWNLLVPMLAEIERLLKKEAPILEGRYRNSITLFADDAPVSVETAQEGAREYYFAATVPYARKIERGLSAKAPNGVFEAVAAVVAARYVNLAFIRFGFRSVRTGEISAWAGSARVVAKQSVRNRDMSKRSSWLTRQPAIVIKMR